MTTFGTIKIRVHPTPAGPHAVKMLIFHPMRNDDYVEEVVFSVDQTMYCRIHLTENVSVDPMVHFTLEEPLRHGQAIEVRWRDRRGRSMVHTGVFTKDGLRLEPAGPPITDNEHKAEEATGGSPEASSEPVMCNRPRSE